ncbi:MAG: protein translocase subunit SecD [Methylococcaceae bacterium]
MQNHFPLWKNLLVLIVFLIGIIYALPNLFGDDPSIQVSPTRSAKLEQTQIDKIKQTLKENALPFKGLESDQQKLLFRFENTEQQLHASDVVKAALGSDYTVALNLAPATPGWLRAIKASPMYLGLDLRGGVHFLLDVDMEAAIKQAEERYGDDIRAALRNKKVRYKSVARDGHTIRIELQKTDAMIAATEVMETNFPSLELKELPEINGFVATLDESEQRDIRKFALDQNMTTLRNRVNELGVAEPVIQQQGDRRIVIQLPGVQDTARAKEILGATATLEFKLVDFEHDVQNALDGKIPLGAKLYKERNGSPVLLKRGIIVTGNQVVDASSGIEQTNGSPSVFVTLNSIGAKKMSQITQKNIGKPMAVVFIENKIHSKMVDGQLTQEKERVEEVINIATIRDTLSKRFQITGLDNTQEARNLALLLRAGALAAPVDIVEERTVGPSLGKDNIKQGFISVVAGFVLVLIFMALYYKYFGLIANIALLFNLIIIVAVLSMMQATLTLPGIAGIVLTIGMAVDANVLIYERIREEIKNGNSPQTSIYAGYEKAFTTIFDANITTLIAALVLFGFGTGPIKGFAVTLSIGILSSMFTAIIGSRMFVNWIYGNKKVKKLAI